MGFTEIETGEVLFGQARMQLTLIDFCQARISQTKTSLALCRSGPVESELLQSNCSFEIR